MSRHGSVRRRGAPLSLLVAGAAAIVVALVMQHGGIGRDGGERAGQSVGPDAVGATEADAPGAGPSGAGPSSAAGTASGAAGAIRQLPQGLEDRGWIAEVASQRWIAGSLSGRILVLPNDEIGLTATATSVVSVRYSGSGATSTVRVRDFAGRRLRVSVDRPGTISSAVIAGSTLFVAGDTGTGGGADAGVQAISLADGSVRDLIPAGPAPADAPGPVTRGQLRLSPSGRTLGAPLCAGDQCSVDLVDLPTGARSTPVRNANAFLLALTDQVIFLTDGFSTSIRAVDAATGQERWSLVNAQIGGVAPSSDGARVVIAYLPDLDRGGPFTFTLASADAATGGLTVLLRRPADAEAPTFHPGLSGDQFAVIGNGGPLSEVLAGTGHRVALTLVDAISGTTLPDALTLAAP